MLLWQRPVFKWAASGTTPNWAKTLVGTVNKNKAAESGDGSRGDAKTKKAANTETGRDLDPSVQHTKPDPKRDVQ